MGSVSDGTLMSHRVVAERASTQNSHLTPGEIGAFVRGVHKRPVVSNGIWLLSCVYIGVRCWMVEAWKAVVDGVQDARARAHMKQLSFTGVFAVLPVDCTSVVLE